MAAPVAPKPIKPAAPKKPAVTTGTTRPSGSIAQPRPTTTKSPIGPGSGYLQNKKPLTTGPTGSKITPPAAPPALKPTFTDVDNGDGTITRTYSDGTVEIVAGGRGAGQSTDPATAELLRRDEANRRSAFKVLEDTFNSYGLGSLVPVVRTFMEQGLSDDEAVIQLRQTPEYKQRFLGNECRRAKGLYAYS